MTRGAPRAPFPRSAWWSRLSSRAAAGGEASPRREDRQGRQRGGARGRSGQARGRERVEPADCPALVGSLLGFDSPASWRGSMNVLVQLAVSMRAHGRGGAAAGGALRPRELARLHGGAHVLCDPAAVRGLGDLLRDGGTRQEDRHSQQALREVVDVIAGLTAVDGAAVMTDTLRAARVRRQDRAAARVAASRAGDGDGTGGGRRTARHDTGAVGGHAASLGRAVRARPARRHRARRVAGPPLHGVRVVAVRGARARPSSRNAAAIELEAPASAPA